MADEKVLEPVAAKISLKLEKDFDPKEFYQDCKGLWVSSSFEERILAKAESTKAGAEFEVSSSKLLRYANDKQIEGELPEKHIFSESEVCALVSLLIEKQPNGEEGDLLNTGYWNLFYTSDFVVHACWYSDSGRWRVGAWQRDDIDWVDEDRVFSPAN